MTAKGNRAVLIRVLRAIRGWTTAELGRRAGIGPVLYKYEEGEVDPPDEALRAIAEAVGVSAAAMEDVGCALAGWGEDEWGPPGAGDGAGRRRWQDQVLGSVIARLDSALRRVGPAVMLYPFAEEPRIDREPVAERQRAVEELKRLEALSIRDLRLVVLHSKALRTWAFCEALGEASARTAADKPRVAVELARLATEVSSLTEVDESSRARLEGFVRAHLANAHRVAGDLIEADREMGRAVRLWSEGEGSVLARVLGAGRVWDLESSLRRAQRRFDEAAELLDRAMALGGRSGRLLLNKANLLDEMGDYEAELAVLQEARISLDPRERHLVFAQRFNQAMVLRHLGRTSEAAALLEEVRSLAIEQGREIDLVRVAWLDGRIAHGLGERARAIELTEQARQGFLRSGIGYDAALASLDLALLYLEEGNLREVRTLAREMLPIFRGLGVQREAAAALRLFMDAVQKDQVTQELVRATIAFLERARHDPSLRFRG